MSIIYSKTFWMNIKWNLFMSHSPRSNHIHHRSINLEKEYRNLKKKSKTKIFILNNCKESSKDLKIWASVIDLNTSFLNKSQKWSSKYRMMSTIVTLSSNRPKKQTNYTNKSSKILQRKGSLSLNREKKRCRR
jgi:SET domain-containing protein